MEYGIQLPVAGYDASPEVIGRFAADAERIGLASVWASDCLLRPVQQPIEFSNGMSIELPELVASQYEPLETLSYVAAKTNTIKLGTSVIVAILQNPAALARRFATLDQLSGGRVIAGLGQGWIPQAFEAANVSPKQKGAQFEEHINALRAAWGPDPSASTVVTTRSRSRRSDRSRYARTAPPSWPVPPARPAPNAPPAWAWESTRSSSTGTA
jgi:alkanesulfonate monooxygenase SsuD/methylene tetrahydromethanopterin reductase-like flavin-dependent oxidoreductase (luciferase family)